MVAFLKDSELHFRTLTNINDKRQAYRLRFQVFAEELKWVPKNQRSMEIDDYDSNCVLVGLFANDQLIACLRILQPPQKFMLEKEFRGVLGETEITKTWKTIEVTRFCIAKEVRKSQVVTRYGNFPVIMALEKAFYNWCQFNGKDDVYMVVSKSFFRLLNLLGMPCEKLAPAVKMPDGVIAIAAKSSWKAFEEHSKNKKPFLLAWFKDCEQYEFVEEAV